MDETHSAMTVLAQTIKQACQRMIDKASFDRTVNGVVTGTDGNKYTVSMLGSTYTVSNATDLTYSVGSGVWVTLPSNKIANAFIVGRKR